MQGRLQVAAAAGDCVMIWASPTVASGKEKWQRHSSIHVGEGKIYSVDMRRGACHA
jgi:hypothetical protein